MKPIKKLNESSVAIVGLGNSWQDFNIAKTHGVNFDEVWAINAVSSVIYHDRVFMMDPASRFLDSNDAGGQTESMKKVLLEHKGPIYTCEKDSRCPGLVEYPVKEVVEETECHYLNNTVAYAVAFAYWNKVTLPSLAGLALSFGCLNVWRQTYKLI